MQLKTIIKLFILIAFVTSSVAIGYFSKDIVDKHLVNSLAQLSGVTLLGYMVVVEPNKYFRAAILLLFALASYVLVFKDLPGIDKMIWSDYINPVFAILILFYFVYDEFIRKR